MPPFLNACEGQPYKNVFAYEGPRSEKGCSALSPKRFGILPLSCFISLNDLYLVDTPPTFRLRQQRFRYRYHVAECMSSDGMF